MRIEPVSLGNVHPACRRSAFWEAGSTVADAEMAKELWLSRTLMTYGTCGFSAISDSPVATILFASPTLLPGAQELPSGPVSADATLLSSLFCGCLDSGNTNLQTVLIDAALAHLLSRDVPAVEAFGWRSGTYGPIGLIPEELLLASGFAVVKEHEEVPRYRLELPPADGLLAAAEVEELLSLALC
ncbi:hypothetical protein WG936_09580 [Corynebacterium sp. H127]|uniref:hypothetical protein n=1 Tax=Corynebacterium sp. H127 TaxID=3133418 RepID=UPI0030964258